MNRIHTDRSIYILAALLFVAAAVMPLIDTGTADAAGTLTPRKLTMSSQTSGAISTDANGTAVAAGAGGNGAKAKHTFDFTMATSAATVQSIAIQYCTTPQLGTACTAPTGMDASTVASVASQTGFGATNAAIDTNDDS